MIKSMWNGIRLSTSWPNFNELDEPKHALDGRALPSPRMRCFSPSHSKSTKAMPSPKNNCWLESPQIVFYQKVWGGTKWCRGNSGGRQFLGNGNYEWRMWWWNGWLSSWHQVNHQQRSTHIQEVNTKTLTVIDSYSCWHHPLLEDSANPT